MKAKLGLVLGVNVAVACLVMQGCKAPGAHGNANANDVKSIEEAPAPAKAPANDISVVNTPAPAPAPVVEPAAPAVVVAPAPAPAPVVAETVPAVVAPAPAADAEFTLYTIRPGDMLSKISRRYNIRQKTILDLNPGLAPNKLYVGKKIKLPGKVDIGAAAVAPAVAAPAADAASIKAPKAVKAAKYTGATKDYIVKNGDSLGKIAQVNGTNVRTIKELNGLKKDRLFIGQKLKVPAEKAAATAAKKDAKAAAKAPVAKDAKKDAVKAPTAKKDVKAAAKAPEAKDAKADAPKAAADAAAEKPADAAAAAKPAEAAAAPAADAAAPAAAPSTPATGDAVAPAPAADATATEIHTVKEGEDVVSIAISYGISPSALMDANDLKSPEVKPGDKLKVPVSLKNAQ